MMQTSGDLSRAVMSLSLSTLLDQSFEFLMSLLHLEFN